MSDYVGTSIGFQGSRISEMWGGTGNGSWINTKLPDNTAIHPDSATMVDFIYQNVFGKTTYYNRVATPYVNTTKYTAAFNVVPADQPIVPVYIVGAYSTYAYAKGRNAMAQVGIPIPDGIEPTVVPSTGLPDSDGTILIYQPDWVWPGRPADSRYFGRYYEIWGAISPDQNAAQGKTVRWTAKQAGRFTGVNTYKHAHPYLNNYGTDQKSTASPDYTAPAFWNDPNQAAVYVGYGKNAVLMEDTWLTAASKIPFSQTVISLYDLSRTDPDTGRQGYIDHAIGFMLDGVPSSMQHTKVWPAKGYDASSRIGLPHGSRLRFPANMPMNESWPDLTYMLVKCLRDYGMFFGDTAGANGLCLRMEPGAQQFLPKGWVAGTYMKSIPWGSMVGMAVGSDAQYNILSSDPLPPVDPPPDPDPIPVPASNQVAGHGRFRGVRLR